MLLDSGGIRQYDGCIRFLKRKRSRWVFVANGKRIMPKDDGQQDKGRYSLIVGNCQLSAGKKCRHVLTSVAVW